MPTDVISRRLGGHGVKPLLLVLPLVCASPAAAQLSGSLSFRSDDRFRGHSLSEGRPTLSLDLSYDHPSGIYFDLAVRGVASRYSGPQLLSVEENFGFARRIRPEMSIDLGVTNADYTTYYNGRRAAHYQEYYVGLTTKRLSAHIHYSPKYFGLPASTLYGDVDGAVPLTGKLRLTGHVGVLRQLTGATLGVTGRTHYDYRIGTALALGPFDMSLDWTGGGPGGDYYDGRIHSRDALVVGVGFSF